MPLCIQSIKHDLKIGFRKPTNVSNVQVCDATDGEE